MRRIALLLAASLTTIAVTTPAHAEIVKGERDGIQYEYSIALDQDDKVRIDGVYLNTRERFHMVVRPGGRVRGRVGMRPVLFSVAPEMRDRLVADLKARRQLAASHAGAAARLGD